MSGVRESSQSDLSSSIREARSPKLRSQSPLPQRSSIFDNESDSDESHPDRRPITRVVTSEKTTESQQTNSRHIGSHPSRAADASLPLSRGQWSDPSRSGPRQKASQIARLVKRRKAIQHELAPQLEQDVRDSALFRYDLDKCPDHSDTRAYERTPVDGFGETMLRAMGWRGSVSAEKGQSMKRRHPRLGLGVKLGALPPASRRVQNKTRPQERTEKPEASKETLKGLSSEDELSGFNGGRHEARDGSGGSNRLVHHVKVSYLQSKVSTTKREQQQASLNAEPLFEKSGEAKGRDPFRSQERLNRQVPNCTPHEGRACQNSPHGRAEVGQIHTMQRHKSAQGQKGSMSASRGLPQESNEYGRIEHFDKKEESQGGCDESTGSRAYGEGARPCGFATRHEQRNSRGQGAERFGIEECDKSREGVSYSWDEPVSGKMEPRSVDHSGGLGNGGEPHKIAEYYNGSRENRNGCERGAQHVYRQRYKPDDNLDAKQMNRKRRSRFSDFA